MYKEFDKPQNLNRVVS